MRCQLFSGLLAASLITTGQPASAQELSASIVGMWKLTSFTRKELGTGQVTNFYGERPAGYIVFSKAGHVVTFVVGSDRKAPAAATATDAERAELFKTMYAYSARYAFEAGKVVYELDTSWNETWTNTKRSVSAEVAGNKLIITSPPYKSPADGKEIMVVNTWERID